MFACELADVVPDVMCLSKGLTGGFPPLAATVCSEEVYSPFHVPDRARTFFHGHSYTANPLGCAAANASLQIFESEPVLDRIRQIESIHRERLQRLAGHPMVGEVRWLGDIGVLELKSVRRGILFQYSRSVVLVFHRSRDLAASVGKYYLCDAPVRHYSSGSAHDL